MSTYSRPVITPAVFRDAEGEVIRYGERWGSGQTPDDSYSVTSNLERYLPLHSVAEALIAHLVENFDVKVSDDVANAAELLHTREDVIRAARLTPTNTDGAPLTFVFTSFPSVIVVAGAATEMLFPVCGCDACDEGWEYLADELEWQVLAVAGGNLHERLAATTPPAFFSDIKAVDGSASKGSGRNMTDLASSERLARASAVLRAVSGGWVAWTPRT